MTDNSKKTPFYASMNAFTAGKIDDAFSLYGKALPASVASVEGALVTVKFEVASLYTLPPVKMAVAGSIYLREPLQVGDFGGVVPFDVYMGGVTGLGGGTANLTQRANLATLVFQPVSSALWAASPNPNAVLVQGPQGAVIRDLAGACTLTLTSTGVVISVGGATFSFTSSGLTTNEDVTAGTVTLKTHVHGGVQTGSGSTGTPVG